MSALDAFCWLVTLASLVTVAIWIVVTCFVLQGAFNLCRDVWRALRGKA